MTRPSVEEIERIRARLLAGQEQYAVAYLDQTQDMDDIETLLAEVDARGEMVLSWKKLYDTARYALSQARPGVPLDALDSGVHTSVSS